MRWRSRWTWRSMITRTASPRKASRMSSRRSRRMRKRREPGSRGGGEPGDGALDDVAEGARPMPCGSPRCALTGRMPRCRSRRRYLSGSWMRSSQECVRASAGSADQACDVRDLIEWGQESGDVVAVSARQRHGERDALFVDDEGACCPVMRGRPGWDCSWTPSGVPHVRGVTARLPQPDRVRGAPCRAGDGRTDKPESLLPRPEPSHLQQRGGGSHLGDRAGGGARRLVAGSPAGERERSRSGGCVLVRGPVRLDRPERAGHAGRPVLPQRVRWISVGPYNWRRGRRL